MAGVHDTDFVDIPEKTGKFTVRARQLNESLYELHCPQDVPTMQVIFFHGFQREYENAHLFTWTSGDESSLWPQTLLVKEFPDAQILCVSYYGGMLKDILKLQNREDVDMFIVVENLISDLLQAKIGQEPRCPVVLVGHSFGGLVVKKLCVDGFIQMGDARIDSKKTEKLKTFLDNLKGAFFYATPHHGISHGSVPFVDPELLMPTGPLLEYVKILSKNTARLNSKFDQLWDQHEGWRIAGLGEDSPSKWAGKWGRSFEGLIVPEGSSRYCPDFNIAAGVDHITISRPKSRTSRSFSALESLLKDIAADPKYGPPENLQLLPKSIVGMEHALDDIERDLKRTPRLGFVGMGGVGKTTLAKALFNNIERSYPYTCFIGDVKNLQGSQDTKVKDAMLKYLHCGGKQRKVEDSGLNFLRGKRLLLVLDDVRSGEDLDIVRILCDLVHDDSRFIATSRDREPLDSSSHEVHVVDFLSPESSRKLFLSYAFPNANGVLPDDTYKDLVDGIVGKCGNLPLTLEVIGKHLRGKPQPIWEEALHRLLRKANQGAGFDKKLWAVLRLSYDGLDPKEQDMFLDATTIFYKEDLGIAMATWSITTKGEQETTWRRLVDLSLVWEVHGYWPKWTKTIGMHEHLLNLGMMIAAENGKPRAWNSNMTLELLSAKHKETVHFHISLRCKENEEMDGLQDIIALKCCKRDLEIHGLNMSHAQDRFSISGRKLQKMTNLQYLWLEGIDIDQTDGSIGMSLLALTDGSLRASLLAFFLPENVQLPSRLVHLHVSGVNFSGFTFNAHDDYRMTNLKVVDCNGLRKLPETFERLQKLKRIESQNTSLQSIPDFRKLTSLKTLTLSWVPKAKFPSLPACLTELITKHKFPGPFTLEAHNGGFRDSTTQLRQLNDSVRVLQSTGWNELESGDNLLPWTRTRRLWQGVCDKLDLKYLLASNFVGREVPKGKSSVSFLRLQP